MTEATAPDVTPRKRVTPRWRRWLLDAALIVGIYLAVSAWQERHLLDDYAPAPAFSAASLTGAPVTLHDFRGKRVLLHFWATWCGVCRREFPALNSVHAGLGEDEVLLTVVADGDDVEAVRRLVQEEGIEYPVLLGTDAIVRAYRVGAFPTNYFIDTDGFVRNQTVGMSTRWALATRLRWGTR